MTSSLFPPFQIHYPAGDVNFASSFFSPQYSVTYAGVPAIEREVVSDVASFGKQIGMLTDAVLLLAGKRDDEAIRALRAVAAKVAEVKRRRRSDAMDAARDSLEALRKLDEKALEWLLREFRTKQPSTE